MKTEYENIRLYEIKVRTQKPKIFHFTIKRHDFGKRKVIPTIFKLDLYIVVKSIT